jgi:anti-sigma factor ChrR (cupin superfamily)
MELNADFSRRVAVHAARLAWTPSPMAGVERRMLDRIGGEVARATSIVRYAPQSHFSAHTHDGGEEFLVLEGVFQDEHGDYAAGSYIRNPPTSSHTPGSRTGCTIFVKLWQFDADDRLEVRLDTTRMTYLADAEHPGVQTLPLFQDSHETVMLQRWAPAAEIWLPTAGGMELLVLDGEFSDGTERFEVLSWLRLPSAASARVVTGPAGCRVWLKTGHLRTTRAPPVSATISRR